MTIKSQCKKTSLCATRRSSARSPIVAWLRPHRSVCGNIVIKVAVHVVAGCNSDEGAARSGKVTSGSGESRDERGARLRRRVAQLRSEGVRNYLARVAAEEGISPSRVKQLVYEKPCAKKKANSMWDPLSGRSGRK